MHDLCGNCFSYTLDFQGTCTGCGFNTATNMQKYPQALPIGTILHNRYRIGRALGQGGFGITYLAQDLSTGRKTAIKEYFPTNMATRSGQCTIVPYFGEPGEHFRYGKTAFLDEASTLAQFRGHPNIIQILDYFEANNTGYFAMEYVEGMSFLDYIRSRGGRIEWEDAAGIVDSVLNALSAVHAKGIIHRDVTPDNIYISRSGSVKLLDFGAARYSLGNVTQTLSAILKHGFAPKEQYQRRARQGPYTDVYAVGATLYYALTGARPDDAIDRVDRDTMPLPSTLGARITRQQEDVIMKALAVNPENRYQSVEELRRALTEEPKPTKPKWPLAVGIAIAAALLLLPIRLPGQTASGGSRIPAATQPTGIQATTPARTEPVPQTTSAPETTAPTQPPETQPPVITQTFAHLGGTYEGEVKNGVPHGQGTLTWDGCSYSGNFREGYPNGSGTVTAATADGLQQLQKDSWDYISGGNFSVRGQSVGNYTGLAWTSSSYYTPCGQGRLRFDCGGEYLGTFRNGLPDGTGSYTHSSGQVLKGQWRWAEDLSGVFHPNYPQSTMRYTGMLLQGSYAGFGIMAYDYAGTFTGEFMDGEVRGSGTYVYRMYNSQPSATGTNWGQMKHGYLTATHNGTGLTLNGNLQGYGMSVNKSGQYYIGEVEYGIRSGYGRFFSASGSEYTDQRGLYAGGNFARSA